MNGKSKLSGKRVVSKVAPRVVHCKRDVYDLYIGRPSKWGNPFVIGRDGTREDVIEKFRKIQLPKLRPSLHELGGKVLGCWCKPWACHGDVLIDAYKAAYPEK